MDSENIFYVLLDVESDVESEVESDDEPHCTCPCILCEENTGCTTIYSAVINEHFECV